MLLPENLKNYFRIKNTELLIGAFSAFLLKVLSAVSTFALNIVVARYLGVEQAGYFFLAQAFLVVLACVCTSRVGLHFGSLYRRVSSCEF